MQKVVEHLWSWKRATRPEPRARGADVGEFVDEYIQQWSNTHPKHLDRRDRTVESFCQLLLDLVGEEVEPVSAVASVSTTFEDGTLRFVPHRIDADRIREEQLASLCVMVRAWRCADRIAVELDFSEMTSAKIHALMTRTTTTYARCGLDMWQTIPCNVDAIHVVPPDYLIGWSVASAVGRRLLSEKMRQRLTIAPHRSKKNEGTDQESVE